MHKIIEQACWLGVILNGSKSVRRRAVSLGFLAQPCLPNPPVREMGILAGSENLLSISECVSINEISLVMDEEDDDDCDEDFEEDSKIEFVVLKWQILVKIRLLLIYKLF